jgi:uncharacterized RDD family membrane protein YckC
MKTDPAFGRRLPFLVLPCLLVAAAALLPWRAACEETPLPADASAPPAAVAEPAAVPAPPAAPEPAVEPAIPAAAPAAAEPAAPVPVEPSAAASAVAETPPSPAAPMPAVESDDEAEARPRSGLRDRRDLVTFGGSEHLRADETASEMVTIGGNAVVDGHVQGECVTVFGNVVVNGRVDGELVCVMGSMAIGPKAEVFGEVVSVGGKIALAPTAVLHGEKVEIGFGMGSFGWIGDWIADGLFRLRLLPHQHAWAWWVALSIMALHVLFYLVVPRPVDATASILERKPAMALLYGFLAWVLMFPAMILLSVTVIGPAILGFVKFLATFIGTIAIYLHCGERLGLKGRPVVALIVGNGLFVLMYAVPVLSFALWFMVGFLAFGAALAAFFENMRRESRENGSKPGSLAPAAVAAAGAPGAMAATGAGEAEGSSVAAIPAPPPVRVASLPAVEGSERVGFWPRLGATAIDLLIVAASAQFLGIGVAFAPIWIAYHIGFWAWRATTIGGVVFNLRIVRLDGGAVALPVAAVRAFSAIFAAMAAGIGFMWASWDENKQAWHDKIAGTAIVRVPRGQSLI